MTKKAKTKKVTKPKTKLKTKGKMELKSKTQIAEADVKDLFHADWNYKTDGTEDQIQNLMGAISDAKSCGVLAVREVKKGKKVFLEVMDGNHRLTAIQRLKWKKVPIENFGPISKADAIVLTRQRNEQWFEDDKLKLSNLFNKFVFPEYGKDYLEKILPESAEQLQYFKDIGSMDWEQPQGKASNPDDHEGRDFKPIKYDLPTPIALDFEDQVKRFKKLLYPDDKLKDVSYVGPIEAMIQVLAQTEDRIITGK